MKTLGGVVSIVLSLISLDCGGSSSASANPGASNDAGTGGVPDAGTSTGVTECIATVTGDAASGFGTLTAPCGASVLSKHQLWEVIRPSGVVGLDTASIAFALTTLAAPDPVSNLSHLGGGLIAVANSFPVGSDSKNLSGVVSWVRFLGAGINTPKDAWYVATTITAHPDMGTVHITSSEPGVPADCFGSVIPPNAQCLVIHGTYHAVVPADTAGQNTFAAPPGHGTLTLDLKF